MTPAEVGDAIARIRQYAGDHGRRIDEGHFGVLFNCRFAENSSEAARLAHPACPPEAVQEQIRRLGTEVVAHWG